MSGKYWFIACYSMYSSPSLADEAFKKYVEAGLPALLFESLLFDGVKCVAVYGSDEEIMSVPTPTSDESYSERIRVFELLRTAVLVNAGNFGTKNIDEIIEKIHNMPDSPPL